MNAAKFGFEKDKFFEWVVFPGGLVLCLPQGFGPALFCLCCQFFVRFSFRLNEIHFVQIIIILIPTNS